MVDMSMCKVIEPAVGALGWGSRWLGVASAGRDVKKSARFTDVDACVCNRRAMPPREPVWPLDPHTAAKHDLLRRYLGAWFAKLAAGGFHRRLIFLDGFAGPGIYDQGEPGSPIIALQTLVGHQHFARWSNTEFVFIFVEERRARLASLDEQLARFWSDYGGQPPNVRVVTAHETFGTVVEEILDVLEEKGHAMAPTLAFVDPFGYSDVGMDRICRLTKYPRCEVIFNFMFSWLTRATGHPDDGVRGQLTDLFGTDECLDAHGMDPVTKKTFLHELYERQLRIEGKFDFVLDFEMVDLRGKSYSLFYGTRSMAGLEEMKRAMWRTDPSGTYRFSDRSANLTSLFGEEVDTAPLVSMVTKRFAGSTVTIEEVHRFVLVDTIYGPDHYRKAVLHNLEKDGLLQVISSTRKRSYGYPPGTVMLFH